MNRRLLRALLALYPRAWRDRYGAELASLTQDLIRGGEIRPLPAAVNLAGGAAREWGRALAGSRRAAIVTAPLAIMAVAASLYVTGLAEPHSSPASARSIPAPATASVPAAGVMAPVQAQHSSVLAVPGSLAAAYAPASAPKKHEPRTASSCRPAPPASTSAEPAATTTSSTPKQCGPGTASSCGPAPPPTSPAAEPTSSTTVSAPTP